MARGSGRKLIGGRMGAWCAGVAFGRSRRVPTPAEREVWDLQGLGRLFRAGMKHGRRLDARLEQATLDLWGWEEHSR